jgi:ubiquinone/menaquinone biosynthesis C-methylase UbiE
MNQAEKPTGFFGILSAKAMAYGHKDFYSNTASVLQLTKEDEFLEIGFGSGMFINKYATNVKSITGIDYSADMVTLARSINKELVNHKKAVFLQGDALLLPFADNSFTAICAIESFYFWSDPLKALKEIYRVLKPGGRVVIELAFNKEDGQNHDREVKHQNIVLYSEEDMKKHFSDAQFEKILFNYYQGFKVPIKGYAVPKGMIVTGYKKKEN